MHVEPEQPSKHSISQDLEAKFFVKWGPKLVIATFGLLGSGAVLGAVNSVRAVSEHERTISSNVAEIARLRAEVEVLKDWKRGDGERMLGLETRLMTALDKTDRKVDLLCVRLGKPCKE